MSHPFAKYLFVILTSSFLFCLDQASKIFIHTQFPRQTSKTIIEGFFNIAYVTNSGGLFGLFHGGPDWIRIPLFLIVPLIVIALIVFIFLREASDRLHILSFSLILGGAFGNYADRLRLGYVVDFIDWHVGDWHWPTFNLADSFIVVGVAIFFFCTVKEEYLKKQSQRKLKAYH